MKKMGIKYEDEIMGTRSEQYGSNLGREIWLHIIVLSRKYTAKGT